MKLIAHRGNTKGPNPEMENNPEYLMDAIKHDFDVEVDVWVIDDEICFGHDLPKYRDIPESFLISIGNSAWFHCKNLEALKFFNTVFPHLNYFWHQKDDYTLTSAGYIWTYPGKDLFNKSIAVRSSERGPVNIACTGICSDFVEELSKTMK